MPHTSSERGTRPLTAAELAFVEALSTQIAHTLINAMEAKSTFLRGHSERVAAAAAAIAAELGLAEAEVEKVRLAGRLHDVGKIGVRESVLDKPGALSDTEFAHVREHVRIGVEILRPLEHLGDVVTYVLHHHERLDGSGYPHRLSGDAISLGGRIVAAADVFDALTSPRAHRGAKSVDAAIHYMGQLGVRAVCPDVFPALQRIVRRGQVLVFLSEG